MESAFGEMADHVEISDSKGESLMEKIAGKLNVDNLSSSDSDSAKKPASSPPSVKPKTTSPTLSMKAKIYRMFGREKPVQKVSCGKKRTYNLPSSFRYTCVLSQFIEFYMYRYRYIFVCLVGSTICRLTDPVVKKSGMVTVVSNTMGKGALN